MTPEQYGHWQDLASRMAATCYATHRRPSGLWIREVVAEWFASFDEHDVPCIVNWDNSAEYPEGNKYRERECHATYCGCGGYRQEHGGRPKTDCPECHGCGVHRAWQRAGLVCDMVSEFLDHYRGYAPRCRACSEYDDDDAECRCDEIEYLYVEQWKEQWGGPVHCCIRAGLDMAVAPSGGVIGFTAGDVRRMYPDGVPSWVFPPGEQLQYWPNGGLNGTFAELPDTAGVVL